MVSKSFQRKNIQFPLLNGFNLFLLTIIGSMFLYATNGEFKVIEANTLKETGKDIEGAKSEVEAPFTITDSALPSVDHVTER
jgi:hypothetical protein